MKKITILLAITAIVAGAASCNKIEKESTSGVQVNIAVSDLTPGTKAIKAGWSDGDIINVYLDDATSYVPDFQLTYSGGSWSASAISAAVEARLKATGGKLQGFWEGSNSAISGSGWGSRGGKLINYDHTNLATTGQVQHLTASFANIGYTFDGTTVTANLNTWFFRTNIQIVVTGLPADTYALYGGPYASTIAIRTLDSFQMNNSTPYMPSIYGNSAADKRIAGISNEDGIAFVGGMSKTEFNIGDKIELHLVKGAGSGSETTYTCTKTLTASDLLITDGTNYMNNSRVYAAKVPFTAFE